MNWRLQNPKGFRENIYTNKGFRRIGVSKIQRVSGKIYTLSMNWRLQNPKGFKENIYTNMTSIKISSSVHGATTSVTSSLSWKSGPMGERTPREGIRAWEFNYSRIR